MGLQPQAGWMAGSCCKNLLPFLICQDNRMCNCYLPPFCQYDLGVKDVSAKLGHLGEPGKGAASRE